MPKRKAAAPSLTILTKRVSIRKASKREADHLRPHLKKGREKKEKAKITLNPQDLIPVRRRRAIEAPVHQENLRKSPVRNGKPKVHAREETNANIGMPLHADFLPKGTAKQATHANFFT